MSVPARASTSDRTAAAVTGRRRDVSYRLDIVAPSVGDVVKHAGGWIFDRARAGWRVRVVVGELIVDRPLRILGADTLTFETALSSIWSREHPQTLAVPTELFEADRWVRDWVLAARDHSLTGLTPFS